MDGGGGGGGGGRLEGKGVRRGTDRREREMKGEEVGSKRNTHEGAV